MKFGNLHYFLGIKIIKKRFKPAAQSTGVAACHARPTKRLRGLGLAARVLHGGALANGPVVASRRQGVAGELVGTTGRAPGNESRGEAHPNSGASVG
jgi:hypothetical protein